MTDYRICRESEMGFFSHKVESSELEAGDHIYSWRALFTFAHHGIYVGEDRVVYFNSGKSGPNCSCTVSSTFPPCGFRKSESNGVTISCLKCFIENGSLYRYQYGVGKLALMAKGRGGTCTTAESDAPEIVIHRAIYLLHNGFGDYNLVTQNCESFALYCKTGLIGSTTSGQVLFVASWFTLGRLYWYLSDIGVRKDVKKVEVESLAAFFANSSPPTIFGGTGKFVWPRMPRTFN